jgi:hypothetical protein
VNGAGRPLLGAGDRVCHELSPLAAPEVAGRWPMRAGAADSRRRCGSAWWIRLLVLRRRSSFCAGPSRGGARRELGEQAFADSHLPRPTACSTRRPLARWSSWDAPSCSSASTPPSTRSRPSGGRSPGGSTAACSSPRPDAARATSGSASGACPPARTTKRSKGAQGAPLSSSGGADRLHQWSRPTSAIPGRGALPARSEGAGPLRQPAGRAGRAAGERRPRPRAGNRATGASDPAHWPGARARPRKR